MTITNYFQIQTQIWKHTDCSSYSVKLSHKLMNSNQLYQKCIFLSLPINKNEEYFWKLEYMLTQIEILPNIEEEHRKNEEQQKTKYPEEIYLLIQNSINNPFLHIFKYQTHTTILQQIQKGFQKNKLFKTDKETESKLGYQVVK